MGCNCGGSTQGSARATRASKPSAERRAGGPQERSSGYYSGPRRAKTTPKSK